MRFSILFSILNRYIFERYPDPLLPGQLHCMNERMWILLRCRVTVVDPLHGAR